MKVAIVGATGETGASIVNGLLDSTEPRYVIADVKRFLPCCYAPVMPAGGILGLRDKKEQVINHVKKLHLPYTIVDIGFWYQLMLPRLPSSRIDYALSITLGGIAADGNTPCAFTDLQDIGRWIARIISDPRTLNKMVFAHNTVLTMNQVYDVLDEASGEKVDRNYISDADIKAGVERAEADTPSPQSFNYFEVVKYQYFNSFGIRGDNNPVYARYLGYSDATFEWQGYNHLSKAYLCRSLRGGYRENIILNF